MRSFVKSGLVRSFALCLLLVSGCAAPTNGASASSDVREGQTLKRGSVVSVEPLGTMDRARLQAIASDFPGRVLVQNGARLFRVVYWTQLNGKPVQASGLLAVPEGTQPSRGVVIYFHGTNVTRALAPSQPGRVDGNEETAIFAGNGYYVVVPDYLGLGISRGVQSYMITRPQVDASTDMLRAARQVVAKQHRPWSPDLYMMGFSQGGQSVAGVHREIESRPLPDFRLKGSVAIAGPYNLRKILISKISPAESSRTQNIVYLAMATLAYANYYKRPLTEVFTPELVASLPKIFDGDRTLGRVVPALPDNARKLFQPRFLSELDANTDNWFTTAMDQNETYRWVPVAPLRLYFGEDDLDVPPASSKEFYAAAKSAGGRISAQSLGSVDHQTSAALAYAPALAWFNELGRASP